MEETKHIDATVSKQDIKDADAGKDTAKNNADKAQIIELVSKLPQKERMDLIRELQTAANYDADWFSTGTKGNNTHYDTLKGKYHKQEPAHNAMGEESKPAETK